MAMTLNMLSHFSDFNGVDMRRNTSTFANVDKYNDHSSSNDDYRSASLSSSNCSASSPATSPSQEQPQVLDDNCANNRLFDQRQYCNNNYDTIFDTRSYQQIEGTTSHGNVISTSSPYSIDQQFSSSSQRYNGPSSQKRETDKPNSVSSSSASTGYRTRSSSINVPSNTPLIPSNSSSSDRDNSPHYETGIQQSNSCLQNGEQSYCQSNVAASNTVLGFQPQKNQVTGVNSLPTSSHNLSLSGLNLQQSPSQFFKDQLQPQKTVSNLYKTELCRSYMESNICRYGSKCQFAHGHHELRSVQRHPKYKTDLCRSFHTTGSCPYGARCHFVHSDMEPSMGNFNMNELNSGTFTPPETTLYDQNNTLRNKNNVWNDPRSMADKLRKPNKVQQKAGRSASVCTSMFSINNNGGFGDANIDAWGSDTTTSKNPIRFDIGWPSENHTNSHPTPANLFNSNTVNSSSFKDTWSNPPRDITKQPNLPNSIFSSNSVFSNTSSSGIWEVKNNSSLNDTQPQQTHSSSLSFNSIFNSSNINSSQQNQDMGKISNSDNNIQSIEDLFSHSFNLNDKTLTPGNSNLSNRNSFQIHTEFPNNDMVNNTHQKRATRLPVFQQLTDTI